MLYNSDLVPTCSEVTYIIYYAPFSLFTRNLLLYSLAKKNLYLSKLMMYRLINFLKNFFLFFYFLDIIIIPGIFIGIVIGQLVIGYIKRGIFFC